jgi:hypothetical protein
VGFLRRLVALAVLCVAVSTAAARPAPAAEPPPNDDEFSSHWLDFGDATELTISVDTSGATTVPGERGTNSVWYSFQAGHHALAIDTCGSSYDTLVEVYQSSWTNGVRDLLTSNDNGASCGNGASEVRAFYGSALGIRIAAATGGVGGELSVRFRRDKCRRTSARAT